MTNYFNDKKMALPSLGHPPLLLELLQWLLKIKKKKKAKSKKQKYQTKTKPTKSQLSYLLDYFLKKQTKKFPQIRQPSKLVEFLSGRLHACLLVNWYFSESDLTWIML